MEKLSNELLSGLYAMADTLRQSKPLQPEYATQRRQAMEWAIGLLRENGRDDKWFCVELHEKYIDLRQKSGVFISDYRLQKVLAKMKLPEINFSLSSDTHTNVGILSNTFERLYHAREEANTADHNDYIIRSPFSSTAFFYEAKTMLLWCSIDKKDLAKILDLLYDGGLHWYAWDILKSLKFDPLTGKHWMDGRPEHKKKKRQVIIQEKSNDDDGGTEDAVPEGTAENPGDH